MTKSPPYGAVPAAALIDPNMTLLSYRTLHCIAFHDRMSAVKGRGDGCTAGRERLLALIGCDNTSLSKALSYLEDAGYIAAERQAKDSRKKSYRVNYPGWDAWERDEKEALETWPLRQVSRRAYRAGTAEQVGGAANNASRNLAASAEIVGLRAAGNGENPPISAPQHDREHNSSEEGEHNSAEAGLPTGGSPVAIIEKLPSESERHRPSTAALGSAGGNGARVLELFDSSAPQSIDLRQRLLRFLRAAPYGAQGRLALAAGITGTDLSRLKNRDALPDEKRDRLALALSVAEQDVFAEAAMCPARPPAARVAAQ